MFAPELNVAAAQVCTAAAAVFFLPATYISAVKPQYRQWRNILCLVGSVFVFGAAWFYRDWGMFLAEIPYVLLTVYGLSAVSNNDFDARDSRRGQHPQACQCKQLPGQELQELQEER
jgi:hypothetical protein